MKELVIIAVQSRPALWDKRNKQHHNRHVLDRQWKEISKELNSTEKTVKGVWKNLRQEFSKQFKKTFTKSGAAAPETPTWKYFNSLLFLKDQFTPRKSTGNLTGQTEDEDDESNEDDMTEATEIAEEDIDLHSDVIPQFEPDGLTTLPRSDLPQQQGSRTVSPTTISVNTRQQITRTGFKKRITTQAAIGQELVQLEKEKLNLKKSKTEDNRNDEDVGFFNSLLPHVRTLNPKKKMIFRMKVQEILFEMAYSEPSSPHCSVPSPTIIRPTPQHTTTSHRYSPYDTSSSSTVASPVNFHVIGDETYNPTYTKL